MADDNFDTASTRTSVLSIRSMPSTATLTPMPTNTDQPPPYATHDPNAIRLYTSQDPESLSSQSRISSYPADDDTRNRRKLLLIFVHGFMGDETSFQSFPAHLHNIVSVLVSDSHTVHTKIYPRYRSKRAIQVATNDFSFWLKPHESPDTDVVLVGHSMGGLLAAEVALLPSSLSTDSSPFRHRLLGTLSLDTPFLGMHPGVIKSGISSLFRVEHSPPDTPQNGSTSLSPSNSTMASGSSLADHQDPNYNPAFPNDIRLPVRTGWRNTQHFVRKHAKHLVSATQQLVTSHVEFGSCLADLDGLKDRYSRIRMLEDADNDRRATTTQDQRQPPRVRFLNYYTASTGRPKRPQPEKEDTPVVSPTPSHVDEKRDLTRQNVSLTSEQIAVGSLEDENPVDSDNESILSDISDLDTLDDTSSELNDATTLVSSTDTSASNLVIEDQASEPDLLPQQGPEPWPAVKVTPFPPSPPMPLIQQFKTRAAFKLAVKQHHSVVKQNFRVFKEQQKAEYFRVVAETKNAPKAFKVEIKALRDAQALEKKRYFEGARADWKAMHDSVREDMIARRKEVVSKADEKKAAYQLQKIDRKCQKKQSKIDRKIKQNSGSSAGDEGPTRDYDVSTAPIAETINTDTAESTTTSSQGPSRTNTLDSNSATNRRAGSDLSAQPTSSASKIKDRKFCILPPKDAQGARDPTWIRIYMKDVDEVGAHCGLFLPVGPGEEIWDGEQWGERYAHLIQDVAERIEGWVGDWMTARLVEGM